jgi:EthD domain
MIKLVFVIRRREDLSPEEFHRYWREEHGPLAARLLDELGARRYVQTHTVGTDLNGALAVRPEEVVPTDAADGRVAAEGAVRSAVIVEVEPTGERGGAFLA